MVPEQNHKVCLSLGKTSNFKGQLSFSPFASNHGLRTPNECLNQRILKIWADVADKICFGRT